MKFDIRRNYNKSEKQRIYRYIMQLVEQRNDLSFSGIASSITADRGILFQRINFYRLRDGNLSSPNVNIILDWLEKNVETRILESLFDASSEINEFGRALQKFFPFGAGDNLRKQIAESDLEFPRIFLRVPLWDVRSFLPPGHMEAHWGQYFLKAGQPARTHSERDRQFISYLLDRSLLLLRPQSEDQYESLDVRLPYLYNYERRGYIDQSIFEGVLKFVSNSAFVDARDTMARHRAAHALRSSPVQSTEQLQLWAEMTAEDANKSIVQLAGLPFLTPKPIVTQLEKLPSKDKLKLITQNEFMKRSMMFLHGHAYYESSPLAFGPSRPSIGNYCVYLPRDLSMFTELDDHFINKEFLDISKFSSLMEWCSGG